MAPSRLETFLYHVEKAADTDLRLKGLKSSFIPDAFCYCCFPLNAWCNLLGSRSTPKKSVISKIFKEKITLLPLKRFGWRRVCLKLSIIVGQTPFSLPSKVFLSIFRYIVLLNVFYVDM